MNEEIWRTVVGYEGLYEVSNTGRVRSLDRYDSRNHFRKGKVLSPVKNKEGYLQVNLCCNGKCKMFLVHRLVAQAFIPNPDNLPQVNHIDEDKSNNCVDNLEMCDAKYNNTYGTRQDKVRDTAIKNGYWTGLSREESMKKYYQENRDRICEKQKEYAQKYYQKNKDRIIDSKRSYYQEKKDKWKEYNKKWYQEHKNEHNEKQREYYQKNREKICEQKKEYRRKKKEEIQNNL